MEQTRKKQGWKRLGALVLTAALTLGQVPFSAPAKAAESSESWVQGYMDQLVSWGIMRGDLAGNLAPDREISRAEYITMINRAYGYDVAGTTPFTDVLPSDWYADDIAIAYTAGYFTGTSESTASPESLLTREEATVILGRNLMLKEGVGESLDFTDSRSLSDWSRGIVKAAAGEGVVKGYPDGSFRPQNIITRGEVASLLVSAVGTPIQDPGEYSLGSVYGNVTISSSGVTLRDTVIAGDLYISSGVGLGYVNLENVTVLGKIIASGAGESNKGENSIILRNVEADEMVVDSPSNQYVSVRAEGDTVIGSTSVRTPAYLEDVTPAGQGLKYIELNGEDQTRLELAGNIGEVVNLTPRSTLVIAQGSANQVTTDERAYGSNLVIHNGAEVRTLNLDVATNVSGDGDISHLNINSSGSTVTILPDTVTVRPGQSANVSGENMNTVTAAESSEDPRLLSGYPDARDVAPTTATAAFSTNKRGTLYWAVSAVADGSVGEEDLINPPTYASKMLAKGTLQVGTSNTELTAKITRLTSDGSYYLSAVLVDSRGEHSPVKVTSFSTPDDSVPNFTSGYPAMSKITSNSAQVSVMPSKSCQLYYALLPKGSTAPTAADFKANAVTGNLGYGTMDVTKNTVSFFNVNRSSLEELVTYDLYLWLTDFDGAKSSAVKKVSFTTVDGTPPEFNTTPTVNSVKTTSIGFLFNLNEAGTVYWVAVKAGTEYPKPTSGQNGTVDLSSEAAKLQVVSGMNSLKNGRVTATANKDGTLNVTGLTQQTAYDIYYIAQDKAGNYGKTVGKITANTLDNLAPTVTQEFTRYNGNDKETPLADTDIRIIFNEGVQQADTKLNPEGKSLVALYQEIEAAKDDAEKEVAKNELAAVLRATILLYDATSNGPAQQVRERTGTETDWVIDYRNAEITMEDGKTVVTLRTASGTSGALNLKSGSTYYFVVQGIADTSSAKNIMGVTTMKKFTTVFAQVNLSNTSVGSANVNGTDVRLDMSFELYPVSTSKVDDSIFWDMLLWSDTNVSYKLYVREKSPSGTVGDWQPVRDNEQTVTVTNSFDGLSLTRHFTSADSRLPVFERLNQLSDQKIYEYGIEFTKVAGLSDPSVWSQTVNFKVSVAAGGSTALSNLSASITPSSWEAAKGDVTSIGLPDDFSIKKVFTDQRAPVFVDDYPQFDPVDTAAVMNVLLDRPGTIYYVIAPVGTITTRDTNGNQVIPSNIPENGNRPQGDTGNNSYFYPLSSPGYLDIVEPKYSNSSIKIGTQSVGTGVVEIKVEDLLPETEYYVYYVLKGTGQTFSENVMCYRFETTEVTRPILTLEVSNPQVSIKADRNATVDYLLVVTNYTTSVLSKKLSACLAPGFDSDVLDGTRYENFTVMDSLCEDYMVNGVSQGSVFDYYANQETKDDVAWLIRNQNENSDSITMKNQVTVNAGQTQWVDCTPGMAGITRYCFLAVGKSEMGSGDAFRAIRPVFLRDGAAPQVLNVSLIPDYYPGSPTATFEGTLTIQFNEDIYYLDNDGKKTRPVLPLNDVTNNSDTHVSLAFACTPQPGIDIIQPANVSTTNPVPTNIFDFKITRGKNGATISFKNNLCDAASNTRATPLNIKIVYEPVMDPADPTKVKNYMPTVVITPADWDATGTT